MYTKEFEDDLTFAMMRIQYAVEFPKEFGLVLEENRIEVGTFLNAIKEPGVSRKAFKVARKELNIVSKREGEKWYWIFPDEMLRRSP